MGIDDSQDKRSRILDFGVIPKGLRDRGTIQQVKKGTVILEEGTVVGGFYCVISGRVQGYSLDEQGNMLGLALIEPTGSFTESEAIVGGMPADSSFRAVEDCCLLFITEESLQEVFCNDYEASLYVMRATAHKFHAFMTSYKELVSKSAMYRICGCLIELDKQYGRDEREMRKIDYKFSQQYVAEYLSMSRLTVNKCFHSLKEKHLLTKIDDYYCIVDYKKLLEFMEFVK